MTGRVPRDSRKHVLIAGGGVAALEAALALRALAADCVSVAVAAPDREFVYRPLSVAEPFRVGEVRRFPLGLLVDDAGARFLGATIASVDSDARTVLTDAQDELSYDVLLLALGARACTAVPGALTFTGPASSGALAEVLDQAVAGEIHSIVFAVPAGASWPLPLYELALLTGTHLADHGTRGVKLSIVTPEEAPLALFGTEASAAIRELLEIRGIELETHMTPLEYADGMLHVLAAEEIPVDRVVALPRLEGPRLPGIWHDRNGFVPTDEYGRVPSEVDVYAAGDMTLFPLKQGGIAAQQADAAATAIAAAAGAPVEPAPFRPVLRGLLLTGMVARYLRSEPGTPASVADTEPLWWPPAKVVGRYLAPFLAQRLGLAETPTPAGSVQVDVELDSRTAAPAGDARVSRG
jgi:sulfide:quinone oxidoreductase